MPGRCAKDQQSEPMAAPPRHIIEPLPHWLDPLEIMMPPEQRLETWIILRADQPDLQLIQNGLFFDLGQTIWLQHPRNLKKLAAGVQSKVSIPLSRAVFHILMSQPCWYKEKRSILDFRRGPLGPHFDGFSDYLKERGYSVGYGKRILATCCQFNAFLIEKRISRCSKLSEAMAEPFLKAFVAFAPTT